MEDAIFATGIITLSALIAVAVIFAGYLTIDAARCARFIWRVSGAAKRAGKPIGAARLAMSAVRYWLGVDRRPEYLVVNDTDETVYWPGKEGSRRYLG